MLGLILRWFGSPLVQLVAGIGVLGALWAWNQYDNYKQRRIGAIQHVEYSKKVGADNAEKSEAAHDAARKPGAFERMRNDPATCRNCK
jgi:hypothetical protein